MSHLAVRLLGSDYKAAPFVNCLKELGWDEGDGMMNALQIFTAMHNNAVYCPTLSKSRDNLMMVWTNEPYGLRITLGRSKDAIYFATLDQEGWRKLKRIDYADLDNFIDYWVNFISQGDPFDAEGRRRESPDRPRGKAAN